ncbi:MAG: hypothetical protein M3O32_03715, partial [Actinomycetota bacterium]|nr:hypothetical protein [Actinomycetota bacterium]
GSAYHCHQPMEWPALDLHLLATVVDEPDGTRGEVGVYINATSDDVYTLEELRAVARALLGAADALERGEAVTFG